MDLVVSPALVGLNAQAHGQGAALAPGQLIDALVLQLFDATTARLSVAGNVVDVKTQVPLEQGATVRLAVRGHGDETRLVLIGRSPIANSPAQNSAPAAQLSPRGASQQAPQLLTSNTVIVSAGADEAAALAPTPDAPSVVPAQAVREADPAVALANATRVAAAQQKSLAPVFAQAQAALESPGVPPAVKQAAQQLLALRAPFGEEVTAQNVQKAVQSAGLFLEAKLAATARGGAPVISAPATTAPAANPAASPFVPSADMKAVLFTLREALKQWLDPVVDAVRANTSATTAVDPETTSSISNPAGLGAPPRSRGDEMIAVAKSVVAEAKTPPPPYRNAPTEGEQPVSAAAPSDAPAKLVGHVLLEETKGAIARTTLMQAASLPGAPSAVAEHADSGATHWNLEIPFLMPQGTAIAHFEISRDEHKAAAAERKPPGWRVNFSVDVEPMGPVHAQVALTGHRAAVRLWAERSPTATALRQSVGDLNTALKRAALEPSEVVVREGAPPRPLKPGAGRFVDRAS